MQRFFSTLRSTFLKIFFFQILGDEKIVLFPENPASKSSRGLIIISIITPPCGYLEKRRVESSLKAVGDITLGTKKTANIWRTRSGSHCPFPSKETKIHRPDDIRTARELFKGQGEITRKMKRLFLIADLQKARGSPTETINSPKSPNNTPSY